MYHSAGEAAAWGWREGGRDGDCTLLYCTVLYCTVLYCIALYCTVLYFIVNCVNFQNYITLSYRLSAV